MVVANDGPGRLQKRDHSDNMLALGRVFHNLSIFIIGEILILVNDGIGNPDLSNIM